MFDESGVFCEVQMSQRECQTGLGVGGGGPTAGRDRWDGGGRGRGMGRQDRGRHVPGGTRASRAPGGGGFPLVHQKGKPNMTKRPKENLGKFVPFIEAKVESELVKSCTPPNSVFIFRRHVNVHRNNMKSQLVISNQKSLRLYNNES